MFQRLTLLSFTLAGFLLCGCTADTTPETAKTNESQEPVVTTESSTVTGTPDVSDIPDVAQTPESTPDADPSDWTEGQTATSEDAASIAETTSDIQAEEFTTAQQFVEAIQETLGGRSGPPPSKEKVAAAIALAEQGCAKLPEDKTMLNVLAGLLYQTLRLEEDDVANGRRLRLGELARLIAKSGDPNGANTAQVLLLEEAKAHLSGDQVQTAWESIKEAREFGFSQTDILFYLPVFEPLTSDEEISTTLKQWMGDDINADFASHEPFPFDFTLQSFAGDEVSLADFKGKPVIVDFWGTWCPPCVETIPHLVDLQEERKDDIAILGINCEAKGAGMPFDDAKARLDNFLKSQPINYPCLHGQPETVSAVPVEGFPTLLFIDGTGKVRLKLMGYVPKQKLDVVVDKLLAEQPRAGA